MSNTKFAVGQRVKRIEERESVGATVLEFMQTTSTFVYRIAYDEGSLGHGHDGTGWWMEETLEPETLQPETLQPETLQPETLQPETLQPETLQPETLQPETLQPEN